MAEQIVVKGSQVDALVKALQDLRDGEEMVLTAQGDGSLVVAGSLSTVEITTAGTAFAQ